MPRKTLKDTGDFATLTAEQKIERLRGALAEFSESLRTQGDEITMLRARYRVLQGAFTVVLQKLARQSGDAERFVMDMEKLMATVSDGLAARERGAVAAAYEAEVKEMFALLRNVADPTGARTKKPH